MSFSILADEGLNGNIVRLLRSSGFAVKWVLEDYPGISDKEVIMLAKNEHRILITEDKDFGEWVFAHHIEGLSVILLRYSKQEYLSVTQFLLQTLDRLLKDRVDGKQYFVVINKTKVRIRDI